MAAGRTWEGHLGEPGCRWVAGRFIPSGCCNGGGDPWWMKRWGWGERGVGAQGW